MRKPYRHPKLGQFHRLDLSEGSIQTYFVSDAELAGLAKYLNEADNNQPGRRVLELLNEMLELDKRAQTAWSQDLEKPVNQKLRLEMANLQNAIKRKLGRYTFRPVASPVSGGRWLLLWRSPSSESKPTKLQRGIMHLDDRTAVQLILDFARAGELSRLRRCLRCKKWLYAKVKHQDFCSTSCQQKHYAHSDEWRAKRRDYMRDYREYSTGRRMR